MRIHKAAVLILGFGLMVGKCCFAAPQGDVSNCSTAYENHNQVEIRPLKIYLIQGTSEIDVGTERQPAIPGACFTLFTDKDHRLVASAQAGSDGHFEFKAVPPGRYRLIASAKGLCTANISLDVVKSSRSKVRIVVHFRASGIDSCSYGELARARGRERPIYGYDASFACMTTHSGMQVLPTNSPAKSATAKAATITSAQLGKVRVGGFALAAELVDDYLGAATEFVPYFVT